MLWTDRINKLTGVILLLFAVLAILTFVFTIGSAGEANPHDKSEVGEFLADVKDNEATAIIGIVFSISWHMVGLALAAALYLLFRGRNQVLALAGFAGLLAASIAGMAADAGRETVIILADDYSVGGVGGLEAGADVFLEVARAATIFTTVIEQIGATAQGLALIAFGLLIAREVGGAGPTPPRWLGWLAVVAGLANIFTWLGLLAEPLFALFGIAGLGLLIWLVVLGIWLLRQPEEPAASPATI